MDDSRIIGGLDVDTYTDAPLQVVQAAFLDARPQVIFQLISDHIHLDRWVPWVVKVNLNRSHADERDGLGTIRYVSTPYTIVREYVIASDPPHLLAYSIERDPIIRDHVSVIHLNPERYGGTNITWRHYFRSGWFPGITLPLLRLGFNHVYGGAIDYMIQRWQGRRLSV